MKIALIASLLLFSGSALATHSAGSARGDTGESKSPPKKSVSDNKRKDVPCETVCTKKNDKGDCIEDRVVCP